MLFAAGFGTRMRELTAARPKPLIPVAGVPLLDRALALAEAAACAPVVVNVHYLGGQIIHHLSDRPVRISDERAEILDTGGGLRAALPLLGDGPVMTLNPDAVWRGPNPLHLLSAAWDPAPMDALLLVKDRALVRGRSGKADFRVDDQGRITRAPDETGVLYLGAQVLRPEGLARVPDTVFSLNRLWDGMIAEGRAFALPYPGDWCDVGSPEGLAAAEAMLGES